MSKQAGEKKSIVDSRAKFHKKFKEISVERLQKLNDLFLELEKDTTEQGLLTSIGRELHSLKGEAKMLGFEKTTLLLHKLEDLMGLTPSGALRLEEDAIDLAFKGLDSVEELIDLTIKGRDGEFDFQKIISHIDSVVGNQSSPNETEELKPLAYRPEIHENPSVQSRKNVESIRLDLKKLDRLANLAGQVITNQFNQEKIVKKCQHIQARQKQITRLWSTIKEEIEENEDFLTEALPDDFTDTLELFDQEMDQMKRECSDLYNSEKVNFGNMKMIAAMLKGEIMSIRLYPLTDVFAGLRRDVRDIARKQKKRINLELCGQDTEIDRQMLDTLSEIMLHMVRNSIDHGIESEVQRNEADKCAEGSLRIAAYNKGESVFIEVKDDGKGIHPNEVKETAVKNKIITQKEADQLDDKHAIELIFRSGFSTNTTITDTSGRGMGLDIVRKNVEELKGELFVDSEIGKGTCVLLKLPLTLSLLKLILVEIGRFSYGIPSQDIEKCVEIRQEEIEIGPHGSTYVYNGHIVPLIHLCYLLGADLEKECQENEVRVVIVSRQGRFLGLIIDRFIMEQEMVIKTLGEPFKDIRYTAGVTTMGDGELVPVLRTSDLFDSFKRGNVTQVSEPKAIEKRSEGPKRILVAEDSLITREMERNILESAGYFVEVAEDGSQGYSMLEQGVYDLVVTDVEMPGMDGFQLTQKIKEHEEFKSLPVIILTTRDNEEDKKKGLSAGADAYFTKGSLEQGNLLDVIQRLI